MLVPGGLYRIKARRAAGIRTLVIKNSNPCDFYFKFVQNNAIVLLVKLHENGNVFVLFEEIICEISLPERYLEQL